MGDRPQAARQTFLGIPELRSAGAMKKPSINKHQQSTRALTLHTPVLPQLPERIRGLANATYSVHGGVEHMSLDDWREVEQELRRRLENERQKHRR